MSHFADYLPEFNLVLENGMSCRSMTMECVDGGREELWQAVIGYSDGTSVLISSTFSAQTPKAEIFQKLKVMAERITVPFSATSEPVHG